MFQTQGCMGSKQESQELVHRLANAVAVGDVNQAQNIVQLLAHNRAVIDMNMKSIDNLPRDEINVKVHIEDRRSSGCIPLTVNKHASIKDLKLKMLQDHGFPPEVQKWIIGRRMPSDQETLQKLVKVPDSDLFLYLFPAKKVNLTKEAFVRKHGRNIPPGVREEHFKGVVAEGDLQEVDNLDFDSGVQSPAVGGLSPRFSAQSLSTGSQSPGARSLNTSGQLPGNVRAGNQSADSSGLPEATSVRTAPRIRHDSDEYVLMNAPDINVSGQINSQDEDMPVGWQCQTCTFINLPTRPGCAMCSAARPEDYEPPDNYRRTAEEERLLLQLRAEEEQAVLEQARQAQARHIESLQNFAQLVQAEHQDLVPNVEEFDCPICFEIIDVGDGVVLRDCLHSFCRDCLADSIKYCEEPAVKCPFNDGDVTCSELLQEREIKALVSPEIYQKYLQRGLSTAENQAENSYHCKTANCVGWCIYEEEVNTFRCPVCGKSNCLTCKAIHEGQNCKQYQEDLVIRAANNVAARQTKEMLEALVQSGEAMKCPKCNIIVQKKEGCDWLKCTMCKTEICWVTKQARWGPKGNGDTSGGCRCRVNGTLCHPNCGNCH